MKAKYLFYSLALASAFTACTQDELFDAPALESNDAAGRPVAGVVTFVNDDLNSRYNREKADFEDGDKLGLYLMDEFRGIGEKLNANETPWKYQSAWWAMYDMVDYIQTNYGYVYDADTEEWVNRASQLNEGNYIALFPQNELATNRHDLWHAIKGNVDMEDHSSKPRYYVNRDNQFFVGYEQILRDQKKGEATGELRADISMKPILTYQKFEFINEGSFNFKPKKVVFKAHGGEALPNVAYIKPKNIKKEYEGYAAPWCAFVNEKPTDFMKADPLKDECGNVLAMGNYDRKSFSHAAARSMVFYDKTFERIPYGMTEAEAIPVYEYVFNFPADADILYGNIEAAANGGVSATKSTISIALPMFDGWENMEMVVYGEMQTSDNTYRPGILRKRTDVDNGKFQYDLREWNQSMGTNIPMSTVTFDTNYFYQQEEVRVATTEDLINLLTARLSDSYTGQSSIDFDVYYYGNGLEITKEVVDLIDNYEANHTNVDVTVTFKNIDQVTTPIILKAENSINKFGYVGVKLNVEADQTITTAVSGITELTNNAVLTVNDDLTATYDLTVSTIWNFKTLNVNTGAKISVSTIHNDGELNVNGATIAGTVKNHKTLKTNGSSTIANVYNDNDCLDCQGTKAYLTVESGKLTINQLLENKNGVVSVATGAKLDVYKVTNAGEFNVNGFVALQSASSVNSGTINIAATGEVEVLDDAILSNTGTINVEGELKQQIANTGVIFVKNYGHVIVNGDLQEDGLAGIIDVTYANADINANAAKDMAERAWNKHNYFRYDVFDENSADKLDDALAARISAYNYTRDGGWDDCRIIVRWTAERTTATEFYGVPESNITHIDINKDLNFKTNSKYGETGFTTLVDVNWAKGYWAANKEYTPAMIIASNVTVQVDNNAIFTLTEGSTLANESDNDGVAKEALNVQVNGKFKANNSSEVLGECVKVSGSGEVEIDNATFEWTRWKDVKWTGKAI